MNQKILRQITTYTVFPPMSTLMMFLIGALILAGLVYFMNKPRKDKKDGERRMYADEAAMYERQTF